MAATHYRFRVQDLSIEATDRADDGLLDTFFAAYDQAFILPNEKEEIGGFRDCLALNAGPRHDELAAEYGAFREIVLVARDDAGAVIGGANFIVLAQPAEAHGIAYTVNLNYLFVVPGERGRGHSRQLLAACKRLAEDIAREWNRDQTLHGLTFLEINDPFRLTREEYALDSAHAGIDQIARLGYWARVGATVLDWDYVQPALSSDQQDDHTLAYAVLDPGMDRLPAGLLLWHLERFFAISVLKGATLESSASARDQLQRLKDLAEAYAALKLLDLADALGLLATEVARSAMRAPSLPAALRRPRGCAFFTLSILIDGHLVNDLLKHCWSSTEAQLWNKDLLAKVQSEHADSGELHKAINPMFDDIADRSRNLFLRDFLLDVSGERVTSSGARPSTPEQKALWHNVCAEIDLRLPGKVRWQTEGRKTVEVDMGGVKEVAFRRVLCRAFWMAHSNEALSYHLSFEVPYEQRWSDYYGLSMLQKAFFSSESTNWLFEADGWRAQHAGSGVDVGLLACIEQLFEGHAKALLEAIAKHDERHAGSHKAPAEVGEQAWQRLVLQQRGSRPKGAQAGTTASEWDRVSSQRRLLLVLRDEALFQTLNEARAQSDGVRKYEAIKPTVFPGAERDRYELVALAAQIKAQVAAQINAQAAAQSAGAQPEPSDEALAAKADRFALALFLSGFFQNIVDFLQQDGLEVYDGLSPVYPPAQSEGANEGFVLYATPSVVYEVVGSSRSLDGAGRQWIGTCPYIFLVHMTAFHNESLVRAYENNVSQLVDYLQGNGLKSDIETAVGMEQTAMPKTLPATRMAFDVLLDHAFECIRDFRLVTFEQVHKHYSFNAFRYDTEKTFFRSIEEVRGVVARHEYWNKVLQHLTETVDGLKQDHSARFERKIAWFGLLLAGTGVIQTWLAIFPLHADGGDLLIPPLLNGLLLTALGAATAYYIYRRHVATRTLRKEASAWRSQGDGAPCPGDETPADNSPVSPSTRTETRAA